jgi:hypothetical protein
VRNALPIAAIVMALALCVAGRHNALAQDAQPQPSATELQATESAKSDRAATGELDSSPSNQAEDPTTTCVQELAASEEAFQSKLDAKALSEADAEKLNQLLDDADAFCTGGDVKGARQTLATVNDMVAKAK